MKTSRRSLASHLAMGAIAVSLATTASAGFAANFASTSDPSAWTVATSMGGADGSFLSFPAAGSNPAVAVTAPGRAGWIANNAQGTNGGIGDWTFFTFQQTFTLTAEEAATYDLKFQWAADDSGEGFAERGTWTPKFSVNGGALINGAWDTGYTYDYGHVTDVTGANGLHAGANTLTFYVEGNGVTDGMALQTLSFAPSVPEPGSMALLAAGLGLLGAMARRTKRNAS